MAFLHQLYYRVRTLGTNGIKLNVIRSQASLLPVNYSASLSGELTTQVGQVRKVQQMAYVMGKPSPCPENQFLVMCVHTAPDHRSRRQVVRSTWGNATRWSVILLYLNSIGWDIITLRAS